MQLATRESGEGDRVAVLLHGFNCDSGDWWQVVPELEKAGYRVKALDLRGHGHSPRAASYRIVDYANDVIETIGEAPELIIGHSLGARVAGLVVEECPPQRAIFLDPPWSAIRADVRAGLFPDLDSIGRMTDEELAAVLRRDFPRWSDRAIEADVASWRLWDPATAAWIDETRLPSVPARAVVPSLLVVADPSVVCEVPEQQLAAERGFRVVTARGLSHSLFRDDLTVFLRVLRGWI